ncbi:hypothetical protein EVAR_68685_1 [Eumeta japonica]|uniref:F-box domain-containing protein n=1 Tax=Eumeta variegata TaxID=151549 RepID=A0A4C1TS03_EUMVA|nr:hypothetical protein EVAR_68685_1 [Eumeta japonica]
MDNLVLNHKAQTDEDCRADDTNKRKRRNSSNHSDEFTKKRTIQSSDICEDNENATFTTNATEDVIENKDQPATLENKRTDDELNYSFFLEGLCDEVMYEIFKYLDTWFLMSLMNVCKRFQKFILDKRLWENIDLSQQPLPLGILEDKLERSHDKTKCIKLRGPSPCQHIEEKYNILIKPFKILLLLGIDTILVNLEELAIEFNAWFDPYYVMALSKLPLLRYLSLRGCWQMQEFIPYGSIAARHGFKQLEILDLRDTPLNDSDLQCFNAVETLKEIYLQCPTDGSKNDGLNKTSNYDQNRMNLSDKKIPTTSNEQGQHRDHSPPSSSGPSTSKSSVEMKNSKKITGASFCNLWLKMNSRLRRHRHRHRRVLHHLSFIKLSSRWHLHLPGQLPVIEQMMRHNLFWDIVNPLGRVVGSGGPDRLFGDENGADHHILPSRQQPRGTIPTAVFVVSVVPASQFNKVSFGYV